MTNRQSGIFSRLRLAGLFCLGMVVLTGTVARAEEKKEPEGPPAGDMPEFTLTHRHDDNWKDYFPGGTKRGSMYEFYEKYVVARFDEVAGVQPPSATRRAGDTEIDDLLDYDVTKKSMHLVVPETYKPDDEEWGVYLHLSPSGGIPESWKPLFAKRKLLIAAPNNFTSEDGDVPLIAFAMDALATVRELYELDDDRIYIGGIENGGRIALITALNFYKEFEAVFSFDGGLVLQRTFLERVKDYDDRKNKKGATSTSFYLQSETPYLMRKGLKKASKSNLRVAIVAVDPGGNRLNPVQRQKRDEWKRDTGGGGEHERILRTAVHWYQADFEFRLFDIADSLSADSETWIAMCLDFAAGEDVEGHEPRWDRYESLYPPKK